MRVLQYLYHGASLKGISYEGVSSCRFLFGRIDVPKVVFSDSFSPFQSIMSLVACERAQYMGSAMQRNRPEQPYCRLAILPIDFRFASFGKPQESPKTGQR